MPIKAKLELEIKTLKRIYLILEAIEIQIEDISPLFPSYLDLLRDQIDFLEGIKKDYLTLHE